MAASEAEKYASSDKAIADSKLILSAYADSLESSIKKRYIEKISVIGMDPLLFPTSFPGPLSFSSLVVEERDPGCGCSLVC